VELFWPLWESILGFAALLTIAWAVRKLTSLANRKLQDRAREWPYVYGRVEHAEPKMVGGGNAGYWVGELAYSYSVEREYFSGTFHLPARSEDAAWDAVQGWKDRPLIVHYLRHRPQVSAVIPEEQDQPPKLLDVPRL
jgi:hypothetical protein